jgi:hypothetical protein
MNEKPWKGSGSFKNNDTNHTVFVFRSSMETQAEACRCGFSRYIFQAKFATSESPQDNQ